MLFRSTSVLPCTELMFRGHDVQFPSPMTDLYVSTSHAMQSSTHDIALYPTRHSHSDTSVLPCFELMFKGHGVQFPRPMTDVYVPISHALQSFQHDIALNPARHSHSDTSVHPCTELMFRGHDVQFPSPMTDLYIAISHAMQSFHLDIALYPARHSHSDTSVHPCTELKFREEKCNSPAQ